MALQDNVCQPIMISQTRALLCYAAKMEDKRNLYKKSACFNKEIITNS